MSKEVNVDNLTDEQIFSRISRSIKDNDHEALDHLVAKHEEEPNNAQPEVTAEAQEVEAEASPEQIPEGEQVVDTPSLEAEPAKEAGDSQPQATPAAPEIPKEIQEELNRLRLVEQRVRSEMGRVPALQSKIAALEKKLQQEQPRINAAGSDGDKIVDTKELEDTLAQIGEVDPVTAKALQLLRQEALGSVKKTQSILQQKEEEAILAQEWNKLVERIPQAPEVFQRPEWEDWKQAQTPGILRLAESMYADEVLVAIKKFAEDMHTMYGSMPQEQAPATQPAPANVTTSQPNPVAAAVAEQRARRLQATTPTSSPAPKQKEVITDVDALFRQAYAEIVKKDHLDRR